MVKPVAESCSAFDSINTSEHPRETRLLHEPEKY